MFTKTNSFDVILDCTGKRENFDFSLLKSETSSQYLTLRSPVLKNLDTHGLFFGLSKTAYDLTSSKFSHLFSHKSLRWVLFTHSHESLTKLRDYAQNNQVLFL